MREHVDAEGPHNRPLMTATEAARLAFPDLPERQAARRLYRWTAEGIVPAEVILRAGRAVYLRRDPFLAWLNGDRGSSGHGP